MAAVAWEPIKTRYCERAGAEASLEVRRVYPSDRLPDHPPRVAGRRCSLAVQCLQAGVSNCCWAGTNPLYDPFDA